MKLDKETLKQIKTLKGKKIFVLETNKEIKINFFNAIRNESMTHVLVEN